MFWIAARSSLSMLSANWICGAAKLRTDRLPLAFVWSSEAATLSSIIEVWLKRMFAFFTFDGLVRAGVFSDAFWIAPVPLKTIADMFFSGPAALRFKVIWPDPLT